MRSSLPTGRVLACRSVSTLALAFTTLVALRGLPAQTQAGAPAVAAAATSADPTRKKALAADDYGRWNSVGGNRMSSDGKWVVYEITPTNVSMPRGVLHLLEVDANKDQVIANATGAIFSDDAKWLAYNIEPAGRGGRAGGGRGAGGAPGGGGTGGGPGGGGAAPGAQPGAQGGRGGAAAAAPAARRLELRNLATGEVRAWEGVQSFSFSPTSSHLVFRLRAANAPAAGGADAGGAGGGAAGGGGAGGAGGRGGGGGGAAAAPQSTDIVLHDLATRRDFPIGNVGDFAFNRKGDLIAYTQTGVTKDFNGLYLYEPATGRTIPVDNEPKTYSRMAWADSGSTIVLLKSTDVERKRERENVITVYQNVTSNGVGSMARLDHKAPGFPAGYVVSERGAMTWTGDGKRILFSIKEQSDLPDTSGRRGADQVADVDVWRTADERIQSAQMQSADADRNFTFRAAFDVAGNKFTRLTDSTMRNIAVTQDGRWGVGTDNRAYISDYERARADVYKVDIASGQRTLMFKGRLVGNQVFGTTPDGKYYLYWEENHFQAYDLDAGTTRTLTKGLPVNFVDTKFDHPGPKPPYGIVGYTADKKFVILEHEYDMWLVSLDGSAPARNFTNGAGTKSETRFGFIRVATDTAEAPAGGGGGRGGGGGGGARSIDITKPLLLSAYGEWTKKAGFYELKDGQLREIVYEDASFSTPTRATKADRYMFTRQTFTEFPDLRISGPNYADSKKITNANPQQAEYLWGKRMLFDYKLKDGTKLQGILAIPDDYKQGEKRPMLVNFYEKNSQNLHRYLAPSFLGGMGSLPVEALTKGYLLMVADIRFKTGSSHSDMLECVEAATRRVIELGYADPKRIGLNGHSYGGEGAAFIGTRSKLFAAVGMGAGVTDLTHDFAVNWGWTYSITGSGANAFDYYTYGQGRWGTNPWDSPELYRFESARTHVRDATAPFLIMHGTSDGTVSFQEGLAFYNALRFNKKQAILLAYPGEAHGLRGLANRRDLTIRYMQFFDHYLKGLPAPKWITEGVPFIKKDGTKDPGQ